MDAHEEWPRFGNAAVDPATLGEEGVELGALLAELGAELDDASVIVPDRGWRVLRVPNSGDVVMLGAPVDEDRRSWRLAQLTPAGDDEGGVLGPRRARVHPEPHPLRASRADRRRGLRLRWPGAAYDGDIDRVVIDVENVGDEPWRPEDEVHGWLRGDVFHAVGELHLPGGKSGVVSLEVVVVGGMARALPLDPGEYARIPVTINPAQWPELEPGRHELHAMLLGLGVRTDAPLDVIVTRAEIQRHRARLGARHREFPARSSEELMAERLEMLRALTVARERLHAVVDVVLAAASDEAARVAVQQLLGCTSTAADAVIQQSLRRFSAAGAELISLELSELEQPDESEPHAAAD
ncbi:hypothetical protein [Agromyces humi]|uniref:hypothetical protein n=1 Tax=Agromyces humi TaxID=1766800 RepID=UPI0013586EC1|nr:hypothetical protein [Agromyces humi]